MLRRTKIVATLGPATDDEEILREIIEAGLDVARINFSHGNADEHRRRATALRRIAAECGRDVGVMGDLQGPKIRVCRFQDHSVKLEDGAAFFLDSTLGYEDADTVTIRVLIAERGVEGKSRASLQFAAVVVEATDANRGPLRMTHYADINAMISR